MGNILRRCCGDSPTSEGHYGGGQYPYPGQYGPPQGHPGAYFGPPAGSADTAGFTALARDLLQFEITNKVPEELSQFVTATKATQVTWYRKLLVAWKNARPPPSSAEEASSLLFRTLQGHHNVHVQGLLRFYGLPGSKPGAPEVVPSKPPPVAFVAGGDWPQGVQYEIHTLPVEDRAVADGDTITVFVDVNKDKREAANVPKGVMDAVSRRRTARAQHDYATADALQKEIKQAGYKVIDAPNGGVQCLAKKLRVRLKGVDAPESSQPYGQQAKAIFNGIVLGHPLLVHVYTVDQYGRLVGDIHCNGIFIQEALLKKGCVWHYTQYDKRPTFAQWEREAKAARVGLWAVVNPEKPWEYRKDKRDARRN